MSVDENNPAVMSIEGRIALVTGGASGIGLSCVRELLRCGVKHVAICDVTGESALDDLAREFDSDRVVFYKTDVTKMEEIEGAFQQAISAFKYIDIVLNLAGIFNDFLWELEIEINFTAVVRCTLLSLQYMGADKEGRGGFLCNMASLAGLRPVPSIPVYSAIKHGVVGLSRAFGDSFHSDRTGVRVVALCPGKTDTPLVVGSHLRLLDKEWLQQVRASSKAGPVQKPEKVAAGMMTLIREAQSGSVWVTEGERPVYEVEIPHYELLEKKRR